MAIINYAAREMTAKIVYYGPGLSGKTTSIQYIHSKISSTNKGKLVSLATETDRTLFFDFFPVDFGQIGGFKVKFNFYTVPGQVFYNTTRKLVLKGADGVVFVADSQEGMREQNVESLQNLHENLRLHGLDPDTMPFVIQYNKRDIPGALPLDVLRRDLNPRKVPEFETNAVRGDGVMEAMKVICKMVLDDLRSKQKSPGQTPQRPAAPPPQPERASAQPQPAPERKDQAERQSPTMADRGYATSEATKMIIIPVERAGTVTADVSLPLSLNVGPNVERIELSVKLEVSYVSKDGTRLDVGQFTLDSGRKPAPQRESAPEREVLLEPEKKKGFLSRLFGGG